MKYTFHVKGMHCQACVLLTESELKDLPHVTDAKTTLATHTIEVDGNFASKTAEEIAQELTEVLKKHGYSVHVDKPIVVAQWADFKVAVPIAVIFAVLFVALQKFGLVNLINTNSVSYPTAFLIGIVASLSTCMAVVGGLVLSMSATFAKDGDNAKPQIMFHLGRLVSFFVLGGVIGTIGSAFTLNPTAIFLLGLLIGIVMLVMGINLLDVFRWAKKLQPSMPKMLSRNALSLTKINHTLTPLLVGVATFFLPCGFTQSMQIYTLSTGSFTKGAMTMLSFALGTLPVLALISFSSFSIKNSSKSGVFFKSAGLIVILFAIFNLINSFVIVGLIPPIFNF